jgi:hypothetical protein
MSKFNRITRRFTGTSPVRSEGRDHTYEGAPGWLRDPRGELFLLAVTNMVGEDTFYEAAGDRDDRFRTLVRRLAVEDLEWVARLVVWLRTGANMRSASLVAAAESVKGRLDAGAAGQNRQLVASVLQRADEPGELLAYWVSRYGRSFPQPVKRGVADAVGRLYTERAVGKYDTDSAAYRFGDVLELTHAAPTAPWQGDLFAHAIDRRHGRGSPSTRLPMLSARERLLAVPLADRRGVLDGSLGDPAEVLAAAGMSWESLAGWLQGPLDARAWESVIGSMGYMALLRNLRNFDEAGVSDQVAASVAARLADPAEVARSRQLPLRFLSAYRAAPSLRWAWPLEQALGHSLAGVPSLPGRTLVLVDRSGSMFAPLSRRSQLNRADAAALFGLSVAVRAEHADLVEFGGTSHPVTLPKASSVLPAVAKFRNLGSTLTAAAVAAHFRAHDRVVILTDEQAWAGRGGENPTAKVPDSVPVYTWNLAGYRVGHGPAGEGNRHTFGGLSDAAFAAIPLLEAGRDGRWPF